MGRGLVAGDVDVGFLSFEHEQHPLDFEPHDLVDEVAALQGGCPLNALRGRTGRPGPGSRRVPQGSQHCDDVLEEPLKAARRDVVAFAEGAPHRVGRLLAIRIGPGLGGGLGDSLGRRDVYPYLAGGDEVDGARVDADAARVDAHSREAHVRHRLGRDEVVHTHAGLGQPV